MNNRNQLSNKTTQNVKYLLISFSVLIQNVILYELNNKTIHSPYLFTSFNFTSRKFMILQDVKVVSFKNIMVIANQHKISSLQYTIVGTKQPARQPKLRRYVKVAELLQKIVPLMSFIIHLN